MVGVFVGNASYYVVNYFTYIINLIQNNIFVFILLLSFLFLMAYFIDELRQVYNINILSVFTSLRLQTQKQKLSNNINAKTFNNNKNKQKFDKKSFNNGVDASTGKKSKNTKKQKTRIL